MDAINTFYLGTCIFWESDDTTNKVKLLHASKTVHIKVTFNCKLARENVELQLIIQHLHVQSFDIQYFTRLPKSISLWSKPNDNW